MSRPLTRVLILSGIVSMTNALGTLSGDSGQLLAAVPDQSPERVTVDANNAFAFDLYAALSRENPDAPIFFSPYSLSIALAMTAEGARGETAEQMADILHYPANARRISGDSQTIPWQFSLIHSGHAELNKRWNRNRSGDAAIRKQLAGLRKELDAANKQAMTLRQRGHEQESNKFALKSQELAGRVNALSAKVDQFELRVANAIWGEQSYPFRKDYLGTIRRFYGEDSIFPANFKGEYETTRKRINQWAAEHTQDKIQELISKNLLTPEEGSRVRLVLTNAIYFKGEWSTVFHESETNQADFYLASGKRSTARMMHHGALSAGYGAFHGDGSPFDTPRDVPRSGELPAVYPDDDGFLALELPYKGDELAMVLIAPRLPDRLPAIEKLMTSEQWNSVTKSLVVRTVDTFVPRFKIDQSRELSSPLMALGMQRAFKLPGENGAEFDGMCASDDPEHRLMIGKVVHSAQVEVTEKGTEAAAATAVIGPPPPSAIPDVVPFTPQFRADRPFLFAIRDRATGTILFLGRVAKP